MLLITKKPQEGGVQGSQRIGEVVNDGMWKDQKRGGLNAEIMTQMCWGSSKNDHGNRDDAVQALPCLHRYSGKMKG